MAHTVAPSVRINHTAKPRLRRAGDRLCLGRAKQGYVVKGMGVGKEDKQGTATYFVFQPQIPAWDPTDVMISGMPAQCGRAPPSPP